MEYYTANPLKKKCKKKFFQGIHDRFIRDETFRNQMIENGRDEDVCRQWDVLADEDHTHHLTPQEADFKQDIPLLCQWNTDLILNKHCLPCSN